ncbi:10104_t:CDS:10, partial [Ambispora leptoticha]
AYGIVTDGRAWYFVEFIMDGDKPKISVHSETPAVLDWTEESEGLEKGTGRILGRIVWLLKEAEQWEKLNMTEKRRRIPGSGQVRLHQPSPVSTNSSSDDRTEFGGLPLQVESSPPDGKSPSDDRMIVPPSHFQHRPPSDDRHGRVGKVLSLTSTSTPKDMTKKISVTQIGNVADLINPNTRSLHVYFTIEKASSWCLQNFIEYAVDSEINFEQAVTLFRESLDQLNQLTATPNPIKSFCHNYLEWLKSRAGITIVQECRKYFDATKYQRHSTVLNNTVENTLLLNSKTEIIQARLQPLDALLSSDALQPSDATDTLPPKTPPQTPRELAHLLNTPNKRPIEKEELWDYTEKNSVICAFALTAKELETKIGIELTKELSSMRDRSPVVWNSALEEYINTTLKESDEKFKNAVRNKNYKDMDEGFRLYCEKVLTDFYNLVDVGPTLDRKMGERKHIVYQATRLSDGLDVWHLEVAGPPDNAPNKHVLGDSKKTFRTDILNLIAILREHLDCDINLATRIKVFSTLSINSRLTLYSLNILPDGRFLSCELATAVIPFSFSGRHQYKSVLRMMSIFHDELIKQDELLEEINGSILRSENTVRQVLKISRLE